MHIRSLSSPLLLFVYCNNNNNIKREPNSTVSPTVYLSGPPFPAHNAPLSPLLFFHFNIIYNIRIVHCFFHKPLWCIVGTRVLWKGMVLFADVILTLTTANWWVNDTQIWFVLNVSKKGSPWVANYQKMRIIIEWFGLFYALDFHR